jgi:hypothetical protein
MTALIVFCGGGKIRKSLSEVHASMLETNAGHVPYDRLRELHRAIGRIFFHGDMSPGCFRRSFAE